MTHGRNPAHGRVSEFLRLEMGKQMKRELLVVGFAAFLVTGTAHAQGIIDQADETPPTAKTRQPIDETPLRRPLTAAERIQLLMGMLALQKNLNNAATANLALAFGGS